MTRWLIVLLIPLAAACSSPLRETSEPAEPAETPAAAEQPAAAAVPTPPVAKNVPSEAPVETAAPPPAPPAPAPPAEKPAPRLVTPDPVKVLLAEESQRVEREKLITRLAAERDAAAALVARRQKDLLAFKNPFLPRPQLTPEESEEIRGLGGAARAQWAERRVADARATLEAAQQAYDDATAIR